MQSNAENATIKTTFDVSLDTRALAEDNKQQKHFPNQSLEKIFILKIRQQSDHPEKCKTRRFLICSDDNHLLLESITAIQDLMPLTRKS